MFLPREIFPYLKEEENMKKFVSYVVALALVVLSAASALASSEPKSAIDRLAQMEVQVEQSNKALVAKLIEAENWAYQQGLEAIKAGDGKSALEYFSAHEEYLKMHGKIATSPEFLTKKKEASALAAIQWLHDAQMELADRKFEDAQKSREIVDNLRREAQD